MNDALRIVLLLMKGTALEPIANSLESGLQDGRITVDEGKDLVNAAAPIAKQYFPKDEPEINLAQDVLNAGAKYYDAKKAQAEAAAAAPAEKATPQKKK